MLESQGPPADARPRGGPRGGLGRRGDPRGDRVRRRSRASPRWSTSPATCRSTAPSRSRARCASRAAVSSTRHGRPRVREHDQPVRPRPDGRASGATGDPACCPHYHEAIELIGKRWTGAIVQVLLGSGPAALLADRHRGPRALRPAALRAHEGARGPRADRRTVREDAPVRVDLRSSPRWAPTLEPAVVQRGDLGAAAGSPLTGPTVQGSVGRIRGRSVGSAIPPPKELNRGRPAQDRRGR